jgi:hypothetical protein
MEKALWAKGALNFLWLVSLSNHTGIIAPLFWAANHRNQVILQGSIRYSKSDHAASFALFCKNSAIAPSSNEIWVILINNRYICNLQIANERKRI